MTIAADRTTGGGAPVPAEDLVTLTIDGIEIERARRAR